MAWLDRDRMPVRFTVGTSVLSGLILTTILKALQTDIPNSVIFIWFALTSGGVAVISWVTFSILQTTRKRSRRAFLMTSAFSQKYYVAALVHRLHSAFDQDGIDLVLKVPDRDYDAGAQSQHLERLLDRRRDYLGGVIVASEVHRLRDDLTRFCQKSRLPIVFTDLEPFENESEYPDNSAFIGYDTGELGDLAGKWLAKRLRGKKRPRVLIIASREHRSRQERCAQVLRRELDGVAITVEDRCDFVRSRAYDAVHSHVRQLESRQCLNAIFCTNDEMALGAVDALSATLPATHNTVVVGVDGVLEAKALINTANSPLRATVVQDTHRLAVSVANLLVKMHRGRPVPKRTILNAEVYEAE
ncbi:substrate-binding domain-containing protein [Crossiella sp. CA-258035]|uniref:sugar ABC transporter substrate-binding protein n=1 Tax=Crossiella sp. CA-258035 TaxID=2981138 RepID=UPI0024BC449C|nr:substrate-binding domain-containing protein [Crossiella sp. CA-258035]WHT16452.1 substrate-binding domain-containing protein [Crossiella sp. CA-258035]